MKFIIDAQLPLALARFMAEKSEYAVHVMDLLMMESPDSAIWDLVLKDGLVIITKDEDFQMRASVSQQFPKIIWVRIGNCSKKTLLDFFEKEWGEIESLLENGAHLVELRG